MRLCSILMLVAAAGCGSGGVGPAHTQALIDQARLSNPRFQEQIDRSYAYVVMRDDQVMYVQGMGAGYGMAPKGVPAAELARARQAGSETAVVVFPDGQAMTQFARRYRPVDSAAPAADASSTTETSFYLVSSEGQARQTQLPAAAGVELQLVRDEQVNRAMRPPTVGPGVHMPPADR